jgi:AcrR family transcriptional regulator
MSTREAIIEAAAKIFAEKGYEGMTIKLIADEVGVTPPAVYAFFKNKEEVFLQVYRLVLTDHFDIAAYHSEKLQDLPVKEQLYKILVELFNYHIREELQVKIFMRLLLFPPDVFPVNLKEELIKVEEMEIDLFSRIFERGIQSGELRPGDSRAYAGAMLCLMDGLFWQLQRYDEEAFWRKFELAWTQFWEGIVKRD